MSTYKIVKQLGLGMEWEWQWNGNGERWKENGPGPELDSISIKEWVENKKRMFYGQQEMNWMQFYSEFNPICFQMVHLLS